MAIYHMVCSCGQVIETEADTRLQAIGNIKDMMDEETIDAHMRSMHQGEDIPTVEEVHEQIEARTGPVVAA